MILLLLFDFSILLTADVNITDSLTDERVATTLDDVTSNLYNQVILGNPLLNMLEMNPYREERSGGSRMREPIRYGKNTTFRTFGKGETRTPTQAKLVGFSYWNMKQGAGEWSIDWVEEREQASSGNMVDLLNVRVTALAEDMREAFNTMVWQSAVGNNGKDFNGIPFLVPTDPRTGIMGGFDRASRYWWRNWYWDNAATSYGRHPIDSTAGTPTAVGAFGSISNKYSDCIKRMGTCLNSIAQNEQLSDYFIITDQLTYEQYCDTAQHLGTFQITYSKDDSVVKWNFGEAQFRGIPIWFDTIQNGAEAGVMRFLNKKYIRLITDSGAWFTWSDVRQPYNQFAKVRYLFTRGNIVNSMPSKNGILQGITAWA